MSKISDFSAPSRKLEDRNGVKYIKSTPKSFSEFAFGTGAESMGIIDGEHIAFFPIEVYENHPEMVKTRQVKSNGRTYESQILVVLSWRGDEKPHTKWFNPSSLIKRDFPVTVQANEDGRFVQKGLRSKLVECSFNEQYGMTPLNQVIAQSVANKECFVGSKSSDKVFLGAWDNGSRTADTYISDYYTEVTTDEWEGFEAETPAKAK